MRSVMGGETATAGERCGAARARGRAARAP